MLKLVRHPFSKGAILAALSLVACKQAGYQVLRPATPQTPETFKGPDTSSTPPTATVEVLDKGVPVTWTYVGSKVEIRPGVDTFDLDYLEKSKCVNQGIIQATYDLGNGSKPVVDRNECDSLATKDAVYTTPGDYLIQMQVKSLDSEVAWASMTLRIVDKNTPRDQIEGGFTLSAKPILTNVGEAINFTGICELKGRLTVSWDFADTAKGDGAVVAHTYQTPGQYRVTALCSNDSGRSLQASLTVVIVKEKAPKVPEGVIAVPGQNPNIPTPAVKCDPTQGPCQNTTQMPQGSTTVPTASTPVPTPKPVVWYYDPYCACYWHYN